MAAPARVAFAPRSLALGASPRGSSSSSPTVLIARRRSSSSSAGVFLLAPPRGRSGGTDRRRATSAGPAAGPPGRAASSRRYAAARGARGDDAAGSSSSSPSAPSDAASSPSVGSSSPSPAPPSPALRSVVLCACLSMFAFGAATGSVAGAIPHLQRAAAAAPPGLGPAFPLPLDASAISAVVAATPAGAFFASACIAPLASDRLGRRGALLIVASTAYVLGAIAMALAGAAPVLVAGRFVAGVGVGVTTSVAASFVAECAPASARGRYASLAPLAGTAGILASYVLSLALSAPGFEPAWGWRVMLASCAAPAVVAWAHALVSDLPESPRWLAERGTTPSAALAMRRLGFDRDEAEGVLSEAASRVLSEGRGRFVFPRLRYLLSRPAHRRAIVASASLAALQQLCGINVVVYFAPTILRRLGFSPAAAILYAACVGAVQIACGSLVSRVIDRVGRRVVSLRGIVGMAFGLACLSASAAWDAHANDTAVVVAGGSAPSWLALVGIFAYRVSFSCSLGPVPYVVAAEVFANEVRAEGASVSAAVNWGANAVVTGSFLWMLERVGAARTWGAYLGACALAYVVVDRTLEETKGKTLESRGGGEGEGD